MYSEVVACSPAPSSRAFITAAVPKGKCLDWCGAVKMGVTMVGDLLFTAFARNGLLAECLAGSLTITASYCSAV